MPAATNAIFLSLPSFDQVAPLFNIVKRDMGEILSAFEYMDMDAYALSVKHGQGKALSEEIESAECFVLIETSGGNKEHDEEVGAPSIPRNHT